ncbi:MAG: OmpA family protein [Fulvivirga sp.]|nr:OmpA family protein [Fulvivirga sp.]
MSSKKQCDRVGKRKKKDKRVPSGSWTSKSSSKSTAMAEVDPNDTPPPPKPEPKPEPEKTSEEKLAERMHGEDFDDLTMDEKHQIEDEVLKENNIPAPTSEEHERIRKEVQKSIENEDFPQDLEPLYFLHDEDEFAVVDMEPFLVAVEYALQGRMILIEGHTDATGADDYNVQLSIQRVERIRQLMHDMGVPDDRISVIGYGEEKAAKKEGEHLESRRVDFKVF